MSVAGPLMVNTEEVAENLGAVTKQPRGQTRHVVSPRQTLNTTFVVVGEGGRIRVCFKTRPRYREATLRTASVMAVECR